MDSLVAEEIQSEVPELEQERMVSEDDSVRLVASWERQFAQVSDFVRPLSALVGIDSDKAWDLAAGVRPKGRAKFTELERLEEKLTCQSLTWDEGWRSIDLRRKRPSSSKGPAAKFSQELTTTEPNWTGRTKVKQKSNTSELRKSKKAASTPSPKRK